MKRLEKYLLDEGPKMKDERNLFSCILSPLSFGLHPSSFILSLLSTKKLAFSLFFFLTIQLSFSQNISINSNGARPDTSAMLDVVSTNKGMLIPRMTEAQRDAIFEPATGLLIFQIDQDSGFYFNQGISATPNWLRIQTEVDSSLWLINDSNLFYQAGNVGIGIDTPSAKLHLYGNGSLGAGARIAFGDDYRNSTNQWNTFLGESGWDSNLDSDQMQYHGRLGHYFTIGSPNGRLDTAAVINSTGRLVLYQAKQSSNFLRMYADTGQVGFWYSSDSSYYALFSDRKNGGTFPQGSIGLIGGKSASTAGIRWVIDAEGNMGIGNNAPEQALQLGSFLTNKDQFLSIKTNGGNQYKSGIKLLNFADDDGFTLMADETTNNFFLQRHSADTTTAISIDRLSGDVGIGVDDAVNTLDVRTQGLDDAPLFGIGNSDRSHFVSIFGGRLNDPNPFIMWKDGDPMRFATDNSGYDEKMRITSSGFVGIGNDAPSEMLEISNPATDNFILINSGNATTTKAGLKFYENNLTFGWNIYMDASDDRLVFSHQSGGTENEEVTLSQGGNLGIGINSPNFPLDVNGVSNFRNTLITNDNWISGDGDAEGLRITNSGYILMSPALDNSLGNVAIGGGAFNGTKLAIQSNQQMTLSSDNSGTGNAIVASNNSSTDATIYTFNANGTGNALEVAGRSYLNGIVNTASNWISGDGDAEGIFISNAGRVGVNTTNLTGTFVVAGTAGDLTSGLQIQNGSDDWYLYQNPSFGLVFRDDGLDRLQIDPNGHLLPGTDNVYDLGSASSRWDDVFATNGTINTSDIRYKTEIKKLNYGLNEIMKISPISYQWKEEENPETKLGLSAQELLEILPEVVKSHEWKKDENGDWIKEELEKYGVYYTDLIPVLINAIQEQQQLMESQLAEIEKLKAGFEQLRQEIKKQAKK